MAKGTIKKAGGKSKSNKPVEASSAGNTNKQPTKAVPALGTDEEGHAYLSAAYKSAMDGLSIVQEPYLGIVPAAKHPLYKSPSAVANILNKQRLTCLITGVTATTITTEALIDRQNGMVQARRFDKLPLLGVVDCQAGTIFNLTIVTKPGSREFIYESGNPTDIKYFEATVAETTSFYNDLQKDSVFQKGPILNDDGDTF
jgi:hypothetical protein